MRRKRLGGLCVTRLRHRRCWRTSQKLSYAQLDQAGRRSTLITRMTSDINQVQTGMNLALRLLLRSPFVVFGAMVMAFTIDVKAALVFVVAIPLLSHRGVRHHASDHSRSTKRCRQQLDRVTRHDPGKPRPACACCAPSASEQEEMAEFTGATISA